MSATVENKLSVGARLAQMSEQKRAWIVLLGMSAIFIVSALWQPSDEPGLILCPFRALTGLRCPGCGMTHAFCAIAHGHLWRAIQYNPFSPLLFLAGILAWIRAAATLLRINSIRSGIARLRMTEGMTWCLLALVAVWWVARLIGGF